MTAKKIINLKGTIIDAVRTTYNLSFDILTAVQNQGENALNAALDKAPWIDAENRKAFDTWIEAVKTGQNQVKAVLDENFKTFEHVLGEL